MNKTNLEQKIEQEETKQRGYHPWQRIKDWYFQPKFFEKKLYEAIGVKEFQRKMFQNKYRRKSPRRGVYYIGGDRSIERLVEFVDLTRSHEFAHLFCMFGAAFKVLESLAFYRDFSAICYSIPFGVNMTFIVLNRYNRARIYDILQRKYDILERKKRRGK